MNEVAVLIVSTKVDLATDAVVQRLTDRDVPCYRLNTEDYPFQNTLAYYPVEMNGSDHWLLCNGEPVRSPTSIWYRRLRAPSTPDGMDEGIATFCRQEARAAIVGGIIGRQTRWMSHPSAIWEAEYKPYQLQLAASLGLTIPRTVVTNDPGAVRSAFHEFGDLIVKPTRSGHVIKDGAEYAVYTSRLLAEHLDELESARWSPSIYQALIPKKYDIRVTVVGDRCFAAAIDSPSDPAAHIDWRQTENPALPHYPHKLPGTLAASLRQLMEALRLTFGAIDLVETPEGEYVFLEVNPNGQWLWVDDMLNLGISDAVADWLGGASQP
jgi:glutathione synthase/RimK-type ligase-like ATP-grasp enzyme